MEHTTQTVLMAALEYLNKAIAESPSAELYIQRGSIYRELGDTQRALEDAAEAYRLNPNMMSGTSGEFSNK